MKIGDLYLSPYLGIVPVSVVIGGKMSEKNFLLSLPFNALFGFLSIKEIMAVREWNETYKKYLLGKRFKKAIDLGSGTGIYGAYLKDIADKVIAVEKNPFMVLFTKIRFIYDEVYDIDIKDFHDYDNAFVLCLHVIEHLDKKQAYTTLAEIRLKAKAAIIVVPKEPFKVWCMPFARLFGKEFVHRTKLTEDDFRYFGYEVEEINGNLLARFGL